MVSTEETTEEKNDLLACANCGSLLCVQKRIRIEPVEDMIHHILRPHPAPDVVEVICAGCGEVLWES